MADEAPKSAFELAMERLARRDREQGVEQRALTDEQRAEIAEVRRVYEARLAEREILHVSERRKARDEEALERIEREYQLDRERLIAEREHRLEEIRGSDR
jgi:hypothetical protein